MLAALSGERYTPRDIYIDKQGQWHDRGRPVLPSQALRQLDVALIALHGAHGDTGEAQRLLSLHGIPYAGPDAFGVRQARHKTLSKVLAQRAGIRTPDFRYIEAPEAAQEIAREVVRTFQQPVVVKPVGGSSSEGVSMVGGYAAVLAAVAALFADGADGVLIEERLRGREVTVGVVEGLRGQTLYALPVTEVAPTAHEFISSEARCTGAYRTTCPAALAKDQVEELQEAARKMHADGVGGRTYWGRVLRRWMRTTTTLLEFDDPDALPAEMRKQLLEIEEYFNRLRSVSVLPLQPVGLGKFD